MLHLNHYINYFRADVYKITTIIRGLVFWQQPHNNSWIGVRHMLVNYTETGELRWVLSTASCTMFGWIADGIFYGVNSYKNSDHQFLTADVAIIDIVSALLQNIRYLDDTSPIVLYGLSLFSAKLYSQIIMNITPIWPQYNLPHVLIIRFPIKGDDDSAFIRVPAALDLKIPQDRITRNSATELVTEYPNEVSYPVVQCLRMILTKSNNQILRTAVNTFESLFDLLAAIEYFFG